jgi:hypothetical protein
VSTKRRLVFASSSSLKPPPHATRSFLAKATPPPHRQVLHLICRVYSRSPPRVDDWRLMRGGPPNTHATRSIGLPVRTQYAALGCPRNYWRTLNGYYGPEARLLLMLILPPASGSLVLSGPRPQQRRSKARQRATKTSTLYYRTNVICLQRNTETKNGA